MAKFSKTSFTQRGSRLAFAALKAQIAALERIDTRTADMDALAMRLRRLFNGYACLTRMLDVPYAYRARKHETPAPFEHVSQLWYPRAEHIKHLGRVNRIGQPMFYISASHDTATLEMRPEVGELITILSLLPVDPSRRLHVMEIGMAEKESLHARPRNVQLLEETPYGPSFLKRNHGIKQNLTIRSFLATEFIRVVARGNEHEFKKTIVIGEFLSSSNRIDGLQYPSLAGDISQWKGGANLALKPETADKFFKPSECWMIRVEAREPEPGAAFAVRCIGKAKKIDEDGRIHWS